MIHTRLARIKAFQFDCAREYLSSSMCIMFSSHDTLSTIFPQTHVQNGVIGDKHRHIFDTIHALLLLFLLLSGPMF